MSWQSLLQAHRVKRHHTSLQELGDLRDLVERDLQDAAVPAISADRRFATAYNAALQLAKMVIACAGQTETHVPHRLHVSRNFCSSSAPGGRSHAVGEGGGVYAGFARATRGSSIASSSRSTRSIGFVAPDSGRSNSRRPSRKNRRRSMGRFSDIVLVIDEW